MTEEQRLKYGRCEECNEIKMYHDWCIACNATHFRDDFDKWTSGNNEIDYFIQNTQIHAWRYELVLEWYPWSTFSEIEEIGQGGYATVFRAKTRVQIIKGWNHKTKEWCRFQKDEISYYHEYVALKTMGDSDSKDFLNEVTNLYL